MAGDTTAHTTTIVAAVTRCDQLEMDELEAILSRISIQNVLHGCHKTRRRRHTMEHMGAAQSQTVHVYCLASANLDSGKKKKTWITGERPLHPMRPGAGKHRTPDLRLSNRQRGMVGYTELGKHAQPIPDELAGPSLSLDEHKVGIIGTTPERDRLTDSARGQATLEGAQRKDLQEPYITNSANNRPHQGGSGAMG